MIKELIYTVSWPLFALATIQATLWLISGAF